MNVFLTGATGYIGSVVAESLIYHGNRVTGLARSEESAAKLRESGITPIIGDIKNASGIAEGAGACDAVVHTASTNGPDAADADLLTVKTILGSLKKTSKPFVYTSGVWVLGNTGDVVADEHSPLNPTPLVAWRPAVEQQVLDAASHGIRTVVIRPAVVYGRGGGLVSSFTKSAKETGAARYIGSGENRWPLVHVDDLADLYVIALQRAKPGTMMYAAFGPSIRVRRIAEEASRAAGAEGRTKSWPVEDARAKLGPLVDALLLDQQISATRAISEYDWMPKANSLLEELARNA